jgi:hypothetical protein
MDCWLQPSQPIQHMAFLDRMDGTMATGCRVNSAIEVLHLQFFLLILALHAGILFVSSVALGCMPVIMRSAVCLYRARLYACM